MRFLGCTAKSVRSQMCLTQKVMAEKLQITVVHLSNIENNKSMPSAQLIEKYAEISGIDLYVLDWCRDPESSGLPESVRDAADRLAKIWGRELESKFVK